MSNELRGAYESSDAAAIVWGQVSDGRLTVMVESPFEVAQFALMLVHGAQGTPGAGELVLRVSHCDYASCELVFVLRDGREVVGEVRTPFSLFVPVEGESMCPFVSRIVASLLPLMAARVPVAA